MIVCEYYQQDRNFNGAFTCGCKQMVSMVVASVLFLQASLNMSKSIVALSFIVDMSNTERMLTSKGF